MFQAFQIASTLLLCSTAWADAVTVQAPCTDVPGDGSGLRSCEEVLSSPTGTFPLLKKRIDEYLHTLYTTGKDSNVLDPSASADFGPTLCSVVPGPFTPTAEIVTNRAGKSCGKPMKVVVSDRGRKVTLDPSNQDGLPLEEGYLRGGFVAALSCFHSGLVKEIETKRRFVSHPSCQALARDVLELGNGADKVIQALRAQLQGQRNLGDILNCISPAAQPSPGAGADPGPLRQSAQQLCAARRAIESTFSQLVVCEIFARAGHAHKNIIALDSARKAELQLISDAVVKTCKARCGRKTPNISPSPTAAQTAEIEGQLMAAANNCANKCYVKELPVQMRARQEQLWPPAAASVSSCKETRQ